MTANMKRLALFAIYCGITLTSSPTRAQDIRVLEPFDGQYVTKNKIRVEAEIHTAEPPAHVECWIDEHRVAVSTQIRSIGEQTYSISFHIKNQNALGGHHLRIRVIDRNGNADTSSSVYFTQAEYDGDDNLNF